ncbi:unnamed protein product, partial [Allacma fusca]
MGNYTAVEKSDASPYHR